MNDQSSIDPVHARTPKVAGKSSVRQISPVNRRRSIAWLALPLIAAIAAIATMFAWQERRLAEAEIRVIERELIEAKQAELANYMSIARSAFNNIYGRAAPDDEEAKLAISQILAALSYGDDGFFFVYDYDGNNLVSPKQTYLIGKNWLDTKDQNGTPVVEELIRKARAGGGYHRYQWPKPSNNEPGDMYTYVVGLQDWRWALGTGIFIDDIVAHVDELRDNTRARVRADIAWISAIAVATLVCVYVSLLIMGHKERKASNEQLDTLTKRIFRTQEEERGRVARELHDGISQMLAGVRFTLELAARKLDKGDTAISPEIESGTQELKAAISEVRRISRDLRPGLLDDLGLGPALQSLVDEFSTRSGVEGRFETEVFRNRLTDDAKTALFRVAQESLTNIERHAQATEMSLRLRGTRDGVRMSIRDNGTGFDVSQKGGGLGLRNMKERIEHIGGSLSIESGPDGTHIRANLPPHHFLNAKDAVR